MKYSLMFLALVLLCACNNRQAGLNTYHEALALMEKGDAPSALKKLEEAGRQARTDSLRALVESQKGTLYFSQRLLDRSLACYQRAYKIDSLARDTVGLIYDLRDMGNVYRACLSSEELPIPRIKKGSEDSCLICFKQARQLAIATQNLPMQRDVESQLAAYHLYRNHLTEARRLLMPAMKYINDDNQSGLLFMMADLYHRSGQRDSASLFYHELLSKGALYARRSAHRVLAEYALADGKTDEALQHLKQYEVLTDSAHAASDAEALRRMSAIYDYSQAQQQAAHYQTRLIVAVAAVALLLVLLTSFILYGRRKRDIYRLRLQRLEQLLEKAHDSNLAPSHPRTAVPSLPPSPPIIQKMNRLLNDVRQEAFTDDDFHELESAIEQSHPGFLFQLQDFCRLSPQERRVCLLLKAEVPPVGIAQLTAHSKQSVTNTRSRLYKKAFGRAGTPAEWDEFVHSL